MAIVLKQGLNVTVTIARARQEDTSDRCWSHNRVDGTAHALPTEDETAGVTSQPVTANAKRPEREARAVLTECRI